MRKNWMKKGDLIGAERLTLWRMAAMGYTEKELVKLFGSGAANQLHWVTGYSPLSLESGSRINAVRNWAGAVIFTYKKAHDIPREIKNEVTTTIHKFYTKSHKKVLGV